MKDPDLITEMPAVQSDELFDGIIGGYMDGFRRMAVLRAAVGLSLFEHTRGPVSAERLAEDMGCDPVMLHMLCDCLASMGLLTSENGIYVSSDAASLYLDPGSPRYQGTVLSNMFRRTDDWMDLEGIVRDGPRTDMSGEVYGRGWIEAIAESSMGGGIARVLSEVGRTVGLPTDGTFLDLGEGHGLYTVAFSRRYPGLRCFLFDRPRMTSVARRMFDDYGCDAVTIDGDFYTDDLGGPYDVVFSSFNHSVSDSVPRSVLRGETGRHSDTQAPCEERRHRPAQGNEWNLRVNDPGEKGKVRFGGSWLPTSEEYLDVMAGLGMTMLSREDLGDGSELVIMRRGDAGMGRTD